jgi:hypothetical protein
MLERRPHLLLVAFLVALTALNVWRLDQWTLDSFITYLTLPIMQTTLFDFACVLAVVAWFIRNDARQNRLTWWWILPTFPFMPTLGLLLYFVVRRRTLLARSFPSANAAASM